MIAVRLALVGLGLLALQMWLLWRVAMRQNNAGWVDVGWTVGLPLLTLWYAWQAPGWAPRKWLLALLVLAWGARLSGHLLRRLLGRPEDERYTEIREGWRGTNIRRRFFWFFQLQGALDVLLSLPMLLAALNTRPRFSAAELAGMALALVGVAGEALADQQLTAFKQDPAARGQVCRRGLWRYSRHPNYFFEWTVWVAWALFAAGSPWGWLGLLSPALMLYFLLYVTGVAATEKHALRSRGEAYREYQRTTSAFVPWFPGR